MQMPSTSCDSHPQLDTLRSHVGKVTLDKGDPFRIRSLMDHFKQLT